jgi:peptidoglycan-N-acetylglucosamine deacetylase
LFLKEPNSRKKNTMCNLTIVSTSWDDGDPKDLRIAELLRSRGLAGTFYVPITGYHGGKTLAAADLRALSCEGFEIGGHGVSHKTLPTLGREELGREVRVCKQILEHELGKEVRMFCYPKGRYDSGVIREVQNAGYQGARTTRMLSSKTAFSPYEMPTTVQAYPHPRIAYLRNLGRARNVPGLLKYITVLTRVGSWVDLGKRLFSQVLEHGGIWHLYGHSWEIDKLGLWSDLREMLDHVSHREGVTYATNGQLLSLMEALNRATKGITKMHANKKT